MADESGSSGGTSPLVVALVAILSAIIGAGATLGVAYFTFASKDQELKVHLVEIAIGILRADPKEDVAPARRWALDVIEKNSGVPFSAQDREALLHKPLADWKIPLYPGMGPFESMQHYFDTHPPRPAGNLTPEEPPPQTPAKGK
jgi:hypothetical protein